MTAVDTPFEAAPMWFDVGHVVRVSLGDFRRRWRTIVPLVLIVWAIAAAQNLSRFATYKHGSHDLRAFAGYWAFAIVFVCLGWLKDAAVVTTALADPGEARPLAHAAQGALRVFLPLLPFHMLAAGPALVWNGWSSWALNLPLAWAFAVDVGAGVILWLYGLVITAFFGLVTPAMLVEKGDLVSSLRRSAALLSAGRWRFLGLSILMDFIGAVPATSGGVLVAFLFTRVPHMAGGSDAAQMLRIEGLVAALLASLVTALWLVITAVSYKEFRRLKEGAPHDQLASIFA